MKTIEKQDTIVFRVPMELSQTAQEKASSMMISKSAICRTALMEYLSADIGMNLAEDLPQY